MKKLCWTIILILGITGSQSNDKLKSIYNWTSLEFDFPTSRHREIAIAKKEFIPGAPLPIDIDVHVCNKSPNPKVFITIPRFQDGVPVTLGYVTDKVSAEGNPVIAPYPNWDWQRLGNCDAITSVYRVKIDECDRLWVLDTGKLGENQVCPPQLLVFSLITNKLMSRYKFPRAQYTDASLFVTPVVDIRNGKCDEPYVYIADVTGFALVVYQHRPQRSWVIHNKLFYPYPTEGTFTINGESFDLMDGILGLALSPVLSDGDRILYFHSLASKVESSVRTSVIRNHDVFYKNPDAEPRSFVPLLERSSQSAAEAMDRNGVLFFGLMSEVALGCWNSKRYGAKGNPIEIIVQDSETLQFASGLKVITTKNGRQEVWVITVSFQKYMTGSLNLKETNFRVQAGLVSELIRGTKCEVA